MRLAVELYGTVIGELIGQPATYDFVPSSEGVDRFGANSSVLSVAVPLVAVSRTTATPSDDVGVLMSLGDSTAPMLIERDRVVP
jgi:hypothetical protein